MTRATTTESLEQRIRALGPWFHNLELDGIQTAPDHFLGDYPRCKWARFRTAIPQDLAGATVLDIACAEAMLRSAGFEIEAHPEPEVYVCRRRSI